MDTKSIFSILGIEQTKDEDRIRGAYRDKLVAVNPEDNPEGFKRLRGAYEEALAYARIKEEEQKQDEKEDPVSLYLQKLDGIYRSISRRQDEEEWERLLREDVVDDLDFGEEVKWKTFFYLMDHYRIPSRIWRVLDRAFGIVKNQQEFKEHLDQDFVGFVCGKISEQAENSEFPYEKFEGEDEADYDVFLEGYMELRSLLEKKAEREDEESWLKEVSQKIAFLDSLEISHPWVALEKAKFALYRGKKEEAEGRIHMLLKSEPEDHRVILQGVNVLRDCGYEEEAGELCENFLEQDGLEDDEIYMASIALAEIYLGREELLKAREKARCACKLYNTEEASELMTKINTKLIAFYTGEKADSLTAEEAIRLAWCFVQTERSEEGREFLEKHFLLEEDTADCHWAKAVMAMECGQAELAIEETGKWRNCLLAARGEDAGKEEEDADQEKKKEEQLARNYGLEGKGCQMLYGNVENKDSTQAEEYKNRALEAYDKAIALLPKEPDFLMEKLLFIREIRDYEEMIRLCRRLKELDAGFFWAYFYEQEAYEALHMEQEVVDTFYAAKEIYAGRPEIYERALRVFWDYGQFGDAKNIMDQADAEGVNSIYLSLKKLELMRRFAESEEELCQADAQAEKVISEFEEQKVPAELLAEAYMERVYIHDEEQSEGFRNLEKMEEWANRALELEDCVSTRYFLGRYYVDYVDDAKIAYDHLKVCEERGMTFEWLYYFLARCCEKFGDWDGAIHYYKQAFKKAPQETDFPWRIAWLYRRKAIRTGQKVYYDEAEKYLRIQEEKFGLDSQDLWQLSDVHLRTGEYEKALREIDQALEESEKSGDLGHKAELLSLLGREEEAVFFYEKAIEAGLEKGQDYGYSYAKMADYFTDRKDYEGGIEWFSRKNGKVKTKSRNHDNLDIIKFFYIRLGQWDKALEIVRNRYGSITLKEYVCASWEQEGELIEDLLGIYQYALQDVELREIGGEILALLEENASGQIEEDFNGRRRSYMMLGQMYANWLLDDEKALYCFQKALELSRKMEMDTGDSRYRDVLEEMMRCCCQLGREEETKSYRRLYEESLAKDYDECKELGKDWKELHTNASGCARMNLYQLFCNSYFTGEYEQARAYVKQMEGCRKCWWCTLECTELWECRGYLSLLDGNREEALQNFERAEACGRNGNKNAQREIRRLRRQGDWELQERRL